MIMYKQHLDYLINLSHCLALVEFAFRNCVVSENYTLMAAAIVSCIELSMTFWTFSNDSAVCGFIDLVCVCAPVLFSWR